MRILVVAALALLWSVPSSAQDLLTPAACEQPARPGLVHRFRQGDLRARECALSQLRLWGAYRALPVADDASATAERLREYQNARNSVLRLDRYYARRAERQQTFLDAGSLITVVAAAGAFEGNISPRTREAWAVAAFTPSIISQFNAYQPTRELFHGGSLAVQLITLRYDRLIRAIDLADAPTPAVNCAGASGALTTITENRRSVGAAYDGDGVLLQEARRLKTACLALQARARSLEFMASSARRLQSGFVQEYVADILALDDALLAKDRDLRFTPIETLAAIVTSPLRAADFAITGENTKAAVDALKTQIAFSGLNRSLASVPLPTLPTSGLVPPPPPLSEAAIALATQTAPEQLRNDVETLRGLSAEISHLQAQQAYTERFAAELVRIAAADYLTFTYDAVTNTTLVEVTSRPVPAAVAAGSTSGASRVN